MQRALNGYYLHEHEIILRPRVHEGQVGAQILTPFKVIDSGIVFINRGWVFEKDIKNIIRPNGNIRIEGLTHTPPRKNNFTPENDRNSNIWYWADIKSLKIKTNLENIYPVFLYQNIEEGQDALIGGQLRINIPNDHLQYAITWYILSFALGFMYILYSCKQTDK